MGWADGTSAQAAAVPAVLSLRTSVSADGTAVVTFEGLAADRCEGTAATISVHGPGGEVPVQVETVRACEHLLRPQAALPNGNYCLDVDNVGLQLTDPTCFDVTGQVPTPVGASLQLSMKEGLRSVGRAEDTCIECESGAGVGCTRTQQGWDVVLQIEGVLAELASSYVFASVTATGSEPDTALPAAPEWFVLGSGVVWPAILPVPAAGEQACVEVYARPVGTGQPTSVGRACVMGGSAPTTLPLAPSTNCGPAFVVRWCADSASDCAGAGGDALVVCQRYGELCADGGAGTPLPMKDGGGGANAGEGGAAEGAGGAPREHPTGGVAGGGSARGCGCRIAPTNSGARAPGVLLAGLALGAYVRRWRRRVDRMVG
jgi:hypothetical protein